MSYNNFCMSSYLTFRYVVRSNEFWKKDVKPKFPNESVQGRYKVKNSEETLELLNKIVKERIKKNNKVGILLSSGIDSAILASFLPKQTFAYTIKFIAEDAIDESVGAKKYVEKNGLEHKVIEVRWQDYLEYMDLLMKNKKSPLHPIGVALYLAAKQAKSDGVDTLIVGNGADSTFGGMDKLLSKDWKFEEFIERYTFCNPALIIKEPVSMRKIYEKYKINDGVDISKFLKVVHGLGIIQTFESAIGVAGCSMIAPYEELYLGVPLDIKRIRNGESKYILRDIFKQLYPQIDIPEKIAFARPMDQWMKNWKGPKRPEFIENLDLKQFTGEQKWLIFCLERFMNLMD